MKIITYKVQENRCKYVSKFLLNKSHISEYGIYYCYIFKRWHFSIIIFIYVIYFYLKGNVSCKKNIFSKNTMSDLTITGYLFRRTAVQRYLCINVFENVVWSCIFFSNISLYELTHLCRPVRSTFAVRKTASLGQQMLNAPVGINGLRT